LNCGIVATFMRDGGIKATLEPFPIPLGSTNTLSAALIAAAFGRPPPNRRVASSWPAARANEALGETKTTKNKKATFTEVFDMGKLHKNAQCMKLMWVSADTIKSNVRSRGPDGSRSPFRRCFRTAHESRPWAAIVTNQVDFLLSGLTPSVDGSLNFARSAASDPFPKSGRLMSVSSDIAHLTDGFQVGCLTDPFTHLAFIIEGGFCVIGHPHICDGGAFLGLAILHIPT
jgi:hypothetical protein